jgi:hypothetical protein
VSKHTSGPWHVTRGWQGGTVIRSISPDYDDYGKVVVEMESSSTALMGREEAKANDRLIASAPDLLAALEECIDALQPDSGEVENLNHDDPGMLRSTIRAAIAQAGGSK